MPNLKFNSFIAEHFKSKRQLRTFKVVLKLVWKRPFWDVFYISAYYYDFYIINRKYTGSWTGGAIHKQYTFKRELNITKEAWYTVQILKKESRDDMTINWDCSIIQRVETVINIRICSPRKQHRWVIQE